MNARTIIYVILVAVVFLGMNLFFSHQNDKKNRELLQQREEKKRQEILAHKAEYDQRTAKLSELPVVTFDDHTGIRDGKSVITVAWTQHLPETITVGHETLYLKSKQSVAKGPVLYAPKDFENLHVTTLPEKGTFDLQLVTFGSSPEVFLGEYQDGLVDVLSGFPQSNAIALFKSSEGYLPVGFYEVRGKSFVSLQHIPAFSGLVQKEEPKVIAVAAHADQKFYVLENDYQQVVFTNVGGAVSEVNLPFRTDKNPYSVVNQIDADREIAEDSPANDHFPAHPYYVAGSAEEKPEGQVGGYYPLFRRSIAGKDIVAPEFYGLNIVSDYPEMAELVYSVKEFSPEKIVFEGAQPNRKITKTYTLEGGHNGAPYVLNLDLKVEGDGRGLWLTSGVNDVEIMSKASNPRVQYRLIRKGKGEMEKVSLPKPKESVSVGSVHPDWMVVSNGYLGMIMDPLSEIGAGFKVRGIPGSEAPTRLSLINPRYQPYPKEKYPGYQLLLPIPAKGGNYKFRLYAGPFEESTLKAVDKFYADPSTGYNPKYIDCRTFYGWFSFISKPFAKLLFVVMEFFHMITHSWGFSIILLTVFLRLLLFPLNAWSFKSMRRMQLLSPQVKAIQSRHKKDPKRAQIEIMTLYREKKVNPFMGCFPILIQLPFLIAMFDLLKSSFQLRGASFIPGWIDNLTAPDVLFSWKTPIFFIGNQFHLLPILLGVVM
ncbi:MAG: membrane protein insertase YidC, partial [Chlamydiales bacterium]|nr:membrane protein insertase YidC [Chlamydiales bacterium]